MKRNILLGLTILCGAAQAQTSGTMQVQLEVLPRVLTMSVSSSHLDFAQQRADVGAVTLDPATGLASHKVGGSHAMGELIVQGPAGAGFLVNIDPPVTLQQTGTHNEVRFTPSWAQSRGCNQGAFMLIPTRPTATGMLGKDGCAALRFGGTIHLLGAAQGHYVGHLAVRITPL